MRDLPKVVKGKKQRVGRGYGSRRGGHTTGRGQKGQKSRGKIGILFEGVKVRKSLLRRLPVVRGKAKFTGRAKPLVIKLEALNLMPAGAKVTIESMAKAGIVKLEDAKEFGVKVLGAGKIGKKLTVEVPASKGAAKAITKAGGSVK